MPLIFRYLAMVVSWAGFTMAFTLLYLSMRAVIGVGGFCAEGGPYVIETHCPGNVEVFLPASIYVGLAAVALNLFVARGLGASLALFAWPTLFIGLSVNFFESGLNPEAMGVTGIGLGVMFFVMGAIPLVAWLRQPGNISAALAGTSHLDGVSAGTVSFLLRKGPDADQKPLDPIDYWVLIPLWLISASVGVWVAWSWFNV